MSHKLIDRESEWRFLEDAFANKKAQLIVVYGRRRIGKSILTSTFINEKGGMYYLCSKGNEKEQFELLSNKLADHFNDPGLISRPFTKWQDLFTYVTQKSKEKRIVLEFDEFPFLITANPAIPSIFQKYWDEQLSSSNVYIVLCGSSIGMMESEVLGYRSPLYGRRTGQWKLMPLRFANVMEFFREGMDIEKIIEIYAVTGGVPFYLVNFDLQKSAIENVIRYIAKKGEPLLEEGEALIREELPEALTYFSILHAIAKGETKQNDISNHVGMPPTALTRYLTNLQRLGFIGKKTPVTETERSKKSLYFISDNFINFWFRFIYPNRSYIEEEDYRKIEVVLRKDFDTYMGRVFEDVCKQAMHELRRKGEADFDSLGGWWGAYRDTATNERKSAEIDIVGIKKTEKRIIFGECKWKDKADAAGILSEMREKTTFVEWNKHDRKETYMIFAKTFKERKDLGEDVRLFDLEDLREIFRAGKKNRAD